MGVAHRLRLLLWAMMLRAMLLRAVMLRAMLLRSRPWPYNLWSCLWLMLEVIVGRTAALQERSVLKT